MKIGFANDHSAIDMKAELIPWLEAQGYEVVNFGTDSRDSTDYAVWGEKAARAVAAGARTGRPKAGCPEECDHNPAALSR